MPDEKRTIEGTVLIDNMPTRISIFLENELTEMLLRGHNRGGTGKGRPTVVLLQDDGTLRTFSLQVLRDADGNERVALIDTNRVPWQREFKDYVQIDGVLLTGAEAELWAPGTAAAQLYEVCYNACSIDTVSSVVDLTIGHGVGAAAIAVADYWTRDEPLPLGCNTGWRGPWVIGGDDSVRGNAGAANDIAVSFRVRQVDVGA